MTTHSEKQAAIAESNKAEKKSGVQFTRPAGGGLLGLLLSYSSRSQAAFFKSKAQGLGMLTAMVGRGALSADEAPTIDDAIRASDLPQEVAGGRFSLAWMKGKSGTILLLLEDAQLMATAAHLKSEVEVYKQISGWIEGYGIASAAELMLAEGVEATTRPPSESSVDLSPFIILAAE